MHLHANAALTVRQRQRLRDLVAGGVTITTAAVVVGCSRQTASKWVNRGRRGVGSCRSLEPSSPLAEADAGRGRGSDPAGAGAAARGASPGRLGGRSGRLDGACRLAPPRPLSPCHPTAARSGRPPRVRAARGAGPRRRQEARPDPEAGRRVAGTAPAGGGKPAGSTCSSRSTTTGDWPTPRSTRRNSDSAAAFLDALGRFYAAPRHHRGAGADRQRQLLQSRWTNACADHEHRRQEDAALPAPDQRQSRTVHPHNARAMGLRLHPQKRSRTTRSSHTRTRLLQSLPTPPRPRRAHTAPTRQQRPWDTHRDRGRSRHGSRIGRALHDPSRTSRVPLGGGPVSATELEPDDRERPRHRRRPRRLGGRPLGSRERGVACARTAGARPPLRARGAIAEVARGGRARARGSRT